MPNFALSLAKMRTSKNSPTANAVKLDAAIRADSPKIAVYEGFNLANRGVAGNAVARREKSIKIATIKRPDLTILLALSLPKTSVITSLTE